MMKLFSLPGPHDVPFAAPLMAAALLAFTIGFVVLKLLDRFVIEKSAGSRSDTK
jgi:hypothetical protein